MLYMLKKVIPSSKQSLLYKEIVVMPLFWTVGWFLERCITPEIDHFTPKKAFCSSFCNPVQFG